MEEQSLGTVVCYLPERGYGFVRLYGTREEFHFRARSQVREGGNWQAGQLVRFTLRQTARGWEATDLRPANQA